jgi:hypothetical protein
MRRKLVSMSLAAFVGIVLVGPAHAGPPPNKPHVPVDLRTTSPSTACTDESSPVAIRDNTPILWATVSGSSDQNLFATFQWQLDDGSGFGERHTSSTAEAAPGEHALALPELEDGLWRWRARTEDDSRKSAWSGWCYLRVDTVPPAAPSLAISEPYAFDQSLTINPLVGATLTVGSSSEDVDRFQYSIGSSIPTTTEPLTGDSAEVSFTPSYGVTQISARLIDQAGNVGPTAHGALLLNAPAVDHAWMLNEDTPGEAPDLPGGDLPLAFSPEVVWDEGSLAELFGEEWDRALRFDGTGAGADTSGPAFSTSGSFTVMAKVRLDEMNPADDFVALSQDSDASSSISIGLRQGRWAAWGTDGAGDTFVAVGPEPVDELGRDGFPFPDGEPDWQAITALYDSAAGEVRLYVDGSVVATEAFTYGTTSDGSLRLGRGLQGGSFVGDATGRVDDAIAASFALTEASIRRLVNAETADDVLP